MAEHTIFISLQEQMSQKQTLQTNYKAERRECSGQIHCIGCDVSIPHSMLATLKDAGRIRAELLRGSGEWVRGKNLEWTGPYSQGNQNKETRKTTDTSVKSCLYLQANQCSYHKNITQLKLKNTIAVALHFPLPCNQRAKKSKSGFSVLALSFRKSTAGWCGSRQSVLSTAL